ncbi:MAG TPA: hypothetical protein VGK30_02605 [Candidatus Binatia bacterium]
MRSALAIALACGLLIGAPLTAVATPGDAPAASAPAPDESRAGMCDPFDGLTFTFCVALCEARSCDLIAPDDETCTLLRRGFARTSDGAPAPCEGAASQTSAHAL